MSTISTTLQPHWGIFEALEESSDNEDLRAQHQKVWHRISFANDLHSAHTQSELKTMSDNCRACESHDGNGWCTHNLRWCSALSGKCARRMYGI